MKTAPLRFFCAFCACLILIAACVRQNAKSAEITALHSGSLKMPDNPDAPKLVYVDASANPKLAANLTQNLGSALTHSQFRMADSPSKAGYILHVKILGKGQASPDSIKTAVSAGYGGKANFSGSGANAMLVDALMVQRRIPNAKRPSRQRLKNITSRNALGSSQMRLAVMTFGKRYANKDEAFSRAIASELALRMERGD